MVNKKIINLIIGENSNLSRSLVKFLNNCKVISARNLVNELESLKLLKNSVINLIFNQFQPSSYLLDISNPRKYINISISTTSIVLDFILKKNISVNRMLYTSSSSLYLPKNIESGKKSPFSLHSSLKLANEELLLLFAKKNNINLSVMRVFNMYGGEDSFSIVSKIINNSINGEEIVLINKGMSKRDFIHVSDVCLAYKMELEVCNIPVNYVDVGSGLDISIISLINTLKSIGANFNISYAVRDEITNSKCNISILESYNKDLRCRSVKSFIIEQYKERIKNG